MYDSYVYMCTVVVQVCLFHKYKYVQMILTSVVFVYHGTCTTQLYLNSSIFSV